MHRGVGMTSCGRTEQYLCRYALSQRWPLTAAGLDGIGLVVVIPALAEEALLFQTLESLAKNPPEVLAWTLVICVVNNLAPPHTSGEEIRDNQQTLGRLHILLGEKKGGTDRGEAGEAIARIACSALRLGLVDASSPGCEIPERDGGVGTARKIGMDHALALLREANQEGILLCLDADTLVAANYLAAVKSYFSRHPDPAAVVAYSHQRPADERQRQAICAYELYLRGYVLGLSLAGSPYAFHAIGSTMVCRSSAYAAVRGMNRRKAAEDFHFLNKLAKLGRIGTVRETTVFPSARVSHRVPFGTGRWMHGVMVAGRPEAWTYDPAVFSVLRSWLSLVEMAGDRNPTEILRQAGGIHPQLEAFLQGDRFVEIWERIAAHAGHAGQRRRQFHGWFDGLRTLRLIHHLTRHAFPPVGLMAGLSGLLSQASVSLPEMDRWTPDQGQAYPYAEVLEGFRRHFPDT